MRLEQTHQERGCVDQRPSDERAQQPSREVAVAIETLLRARACVDAIDTIDTIDTIDAMMREQPAQALEHEGRGLRIARRVRLRGDHHSIDPRCLPRIVEPLDRALAVRRMG